MELDNNSMKISNGPTDLSDIKIPWAGSVAILILLIVLLIITVIVGLYFAAEIITNTMQDNREEQEQLSNPDEDDIPRYMTIRGETYVVRYGNETRGGCPCSSLRRFFSSERGNRGRRARATV